MGRCRKWQVDAPNVPTECYLFWRCSSFTVHYVIKCDLFKFADPMLADLIALGQASGYKNLFYGRTKESKKKKKKKHTQKMKKKKTKSVWWQGIEVFLSHRRLLFIPFNFSSENILTFVLQVLEIELGAGVAHKNILLAACTFSPSHQTIIFAKLFAI